MNKLESFCMSAIIIPTELIKYAKRPQPKIIVMVENTVSIIFVAEISPYPTVIIVTALQYSE